MKKAFKAIFALMTFSTLFFASAMDSEEIVVPLLGLTISAFGMFCSYLLADGGESEW